MKKNLMYLLMMVLTIGFVSSCKDDDKDVMSEINGDYTGTMNLTLTPAGSQPGEPAAVPNKVVKITKTSDTSLKLQLTDFALGPISIKGGISVDNIPATVNGDKVNFEIKNTSLALILVVNGVDTPPLNARISVSGSIEGNKVNANIKVLDVQGFDSIDVAFDGTK